MANEIKAMERVSTESVLANIAKNNDFDRHYEVFEENGVSCCEYTLVSESTNSDGTTNKAKVVRSAEAIGWMKVYKMGAAVSDGSGFLRAVSLNELRKLEVHKKSGFKSFADFATTFDKSIDGKTANLYANIADVFLTPVYEGEREDGTLYRTITPTEEEKNRLTIVDVDYRYRSFRGFSISALQVILGLANDESYGIQYLIDAVNNGDISDETSQADLKKFVKNSRGIGSDGQEKKDGQDGTQDGGQDGGNATEETAETFGQRLIKVNDALLHTADAMKAFHFADEEAEKVWNNAVAYIEKFVVNFAKCDHTEAIEEETEEE